MDYSIEDFGANGFSVVPQVLSSERCKLMHSTALRSIHKPVEPYELESTLGYPGAPPLDSDEGKTTIRRLRDAYDRHDIWRQWAHDPVLFIWGSSHLIRGPFCLRPNQDLYFNQGCGPIQLH